jgi:hypothetical protein
MTSFLLILFVTVFRLVPHAPNFAPMGAVAILSGRIQSKRSAIFTTIGAMVVSDLFLSQIYGYMFMGPGSWFVYGAFVLQAVLGRALRNRPGGSLSAAFVGAFLFFGVSNFGVWLEGGLYPRTIEGFISCYVMALPFFKMTLLGNMVWTPVLSLLHRVYEARFGAVHKALPAL